MSGSNSPLLSFDDVLGCQLVDVDGDVSMEQEVVKPIVLKPSRVDDVKLPDPFSGPDRYAHDDTPCAKRPCPPEEVCVLLYLPGVQLHMQHVAKVYSVHVHTRLYTCMLYR